MDDNNGAKQMSESKDRAALREISRVLTLEHLLRPDYGWGEWLTQNVTPLLAQPDPCAELAEALRRAMVGFAALGGNTAQPGDFEPSPAMRAQIVRANWEAARAALAKASS